MGPFLFFARRLLRSPGKLALTLLFAAISAGGLGVGLLALAPILKLLLGAGGKALPDLAVTFNATEPLVQIPPQVIALEAGFTVWNERREEPRWLVRKQPFIVAPNAAVAELFLGAAGY